MPVAVHRYTMKKDFWRFALFAILQDGFSVWSALLRLMCRGQAHVIEPDLHVLYIYLPNCKYISSEFLFRWLRNAAGGFGTVWESKERAAGADTREVIAESVAENEYRNEGSTRACGLVVAQLSWRMEWMSLIRKEFQGFHASRSYRIKRLTNRQWQARPASSALPNQAVLACTDISWGHFHHASAKAAAAPGPACRHRAWRRAWRRACKCCQCQL